jgi:outer membrane protein assembly factor BamB
METNRETKAAEQGTAALQNRRPFRDISMYRTGLLVVFLAALPARADDLTDKLHDAARRGDVKEVKALLDKGTNVNVRTRYGATALWMAAYKGRVDVIELLLSRKADPNTADTVWGLSPLMLAVGFDQANVIGALLKGGAKGGDGVFLIAAMQSKTAQLQAVLDNHKPPASVLSAALALASKDDVRALLKKAGAAAMPATTEAQKKQWQGLAGTYESPGGANFIVAMQSGLMLAASPLGLIYVLQSDGTSFRALGYDGVRINFTERDGKGLRVTVKDGAIETAFERSAAPTAIARPGPYTDEPATVKEPRNWPSFRGVSASGIADGQHPPAVWDVKKMHAGMWKTPIPGLGHSCPVVWGDRVFVTTAISSDPKSEFKPGLYGALTAAKDRTKHRFVTYCLDRHSGKILWQHEALASVPKVKRHLKASHANATPVTDGRVLIVSFASEGLYGYSLEGKPLWKQDLGVLDAGAFNDPEAQWEAGSSPILYKGLVILQCDRQKGSFIAAFEASTGKPVWRTPRDEVPSWGTPTVFESKAGVELVTNGTNAIRGYDPLTGKELWQLRKNSQITVPTPIFGEGLIFVTNGYRPIQPIYALWPGAKGDISLKDGEESNNQIAWSKMRGGPYMPTPICYRGYLYCCSNAGIVSCHDSRTGKPMYRERLCGTNGYTASPVAADGRLYFTGEDGKVQVVQAGPTYKLLTVSDLGETCLATPAICDGRLIYRTEKHVLGIGRAPLPGDSTRKASGGR